MNSIQIATETVNLLITLFQSVVALLSTIGAAAEVASRFPKPNDGDPEWLKSAYKVVNYLGRNVKHAENKDV